MVSGFGFGLLSPVACCLFPDSSAPFASSAVERFFGEVWVPLEARSEKLLPSRWIFHPLDDPYTVFLNNDAGSSGIAENGRKFVFTKFY